MESQKSGTEKRKLGELCGLNLASREAADPPHFPQDQQMSLWHGDTAGGWTAPGRHLPPDGLSTGLPDHSSPAASGSRRHWRAEPQPRLTASRTRRGPEPGAASLSVWLRGPPFVRGSGCLPREHGCPPSACVATQGSFWNTGQGSVPSPAEPPPASLRAGAAGNTARSWPPAPAPGGPGPSAGPAEHASLGSASRLPWGRPGLSGRRPCVLSSPAPRAKGQVVVLGARPGGRRALTSF